MSLIIAQKIIYYDVQAPGADVPNFHLGAPAHNLGARKNATPSGTAARSLPVQRRAVVKRMTQSTFNSTITNERKSAVS